LVRIRTLVSALDSPPPALLELAVTPISRTADLLSQLSALAAGAGYWEAFRLFWDWNTTASLPAQTTFYAWPTICTPE